MNTIPEKLPDTNPQADSDALIVFPAWLVQGWAKTQSRIKPADADELNIARELIAQARTRGIIVSPMELGVRTEENLTDIDNDTPPPAFGTIEDKAVDGPVSVDPAVLGIAGVKQATTRSQLPPAAGVTS